MHVKKIHVKKFMCHTDFEILLPALGITLITGPNGSGKSAAIEACAALWNRSGRAPKSRKSRGWNTKTKGSVEVVTSTGESFTRSVGSSSTSNLVISQPGQEPTTYTTAAKATEALDHVAGTFDHWVREHVFSAQTAAAFSLASNTEKREDLEEILDLARYDRAHKIAKTKLKGLQGEMSRAHLDLGIHNTKAEGSIAVGTALRHSLEDLHTPTMPPPIEIDVLKARQAEVETAIADIRERETVNGQLSVARRAVEVKQEAVSSAKTMLDEDVADHEDPTETIKGLRSVVEEAKAGRDAAKESSAAPKEQLAHLGNDLAVLTAAYTAQEERASRVDLDACPVCEQTMGRDVRQKVRDDLTADRTAVALEKTLVATRTAELNIVLQDLRVTYQKYKCTQEDAETTIRTLTQQWESLQAYTAKVKAQVRAAENGLKSAQAALHDLGIGTAGTSAESADPCALVEELSGIKNTLREHAAAAIKYTEELTISKALKQTVMTKLAVNDMEISTLNATIADLDADILVVQDEVNVAIKGVETLSPNGARSVILSGFLDLLQSISNDWLQRFGDPMRVELTAYSEDRAKPSIEMRIVGRASGDTYLDLSGGEQRRVDLAIKMAIGEASALTRGEHPEGTLFLDEILDAIDAESAEAVCGALKHLAVTRSLVVITHNTYIADLLTPVQHIILG